jgi:hypothetical protein
MLPALLKMSNRFSHTLANVSSSKGYYSLLLFFFFYYIIILSLKNLDRYTRRRRRHLCVCVSRIFIEIVSVISFFGGKGEKMTGFSSFFFSSLGRALGDLSRGLPPYEDECSSSSSFYVVSLHFLC